PQGPAGPPGAIGPQGPMGPSGSQTWNSYVPLGARTATVASSFTPGNAITVARIQAQAFIPPAGCSTNLSLQLSDGTASGTTSVVVFSAENDSGPLSLNYAAGTPLRLTVVPSAGCSIPPASINVVVQYQGR